MPPRQAPTPSPLNPLNPEHENLLNKEPSYLAVDELSRDSASRPARTRGARAHNPVDMMDEHLLFQVIEKGTSVKFMPGTGPPVGETNSNPQNKEPNNPLNKEQNTAE